MNAAPCSWRVSTNVILSLAASAALRARVSSPGMPNTCRTPSFSRQRTRSSATFNRGLRHGRRVSDQPFDDHGVAPKSVEFGMSPIGPDLAEAKTREERAAWRVLREHARDELPHAAPLAFRDERFHRDAAGAATPMLSRDVDRELRHAGIALPRTVFARAGPGDHAPVALDDDRRPAVASLRQHADDVVRAAGFGLERRDPIGDAVVVDARDRRRVTLVREPRRARGHSAGFAVCCPSAGPTQIVLILVNSRI